MIKLIIDKLNIDNHTSISFRFPNIFHLSSKNVLYIQRVNISPPLILFITPLPLTLTPLKKYERLDFLLYKNRLHLSQKTKAPRVPIPFIRYGL